MSRTQKIMMAISLVAMQWISGCGGGGDGSDKQASASSAPIKSFSGIVAIGQAVDKAEVDIFDEGGLLDSTINHARTGWLIDVDNLKRKPTPPYSFRARFTIDGEKKELWSVSDGSKTGDVHVNITPYSDLITRATADSTQLTDTEEATSNFIERLKSGIGKLSAIKERVRESVKSLIGSEDLDLIDTKFNTTPSDKLDRLLELTSPSFEAGKAVLKDATKKVMATLPFESLRSETPLSSDENIITNTEADAAILAKGPIPSDGKPYVNTALMEVNSVNIYTVGKGYFDETLTLEVTGSNLLSGTALSVDGCENGGWLGGTDTKMFFQCDPARSGMARGEALQLSNGRKIFTFSVDIPPKKEAPKFFISSKDGEISPGGTLQLQIIDSDTGTPLDLNDYGIWTIDTNTSNAQISNTGLITASETAPLIATSATFTLLRPYQSSATTPIKIKRSVRPAQVVIGFNFMDCHVSGGIATLTLEGGGKTYNWSLSVSGSNEPKYCINESSSYYGHQDFYDIDLDRGATYVVTFSWSGHSTTPYSTPPPVVYFDITRTVIKSSDFYGGPFGIFHLDENGAGTMKYQFDGDTPFYYDEILDTQ
jgi:hypothetical protein